MSLLFLTETTDEFRALDDAGQPLPGAVLTFWDSETNVPAHVYADIERQEPLTDAAGRVVANASGVFPVMVMDPDVLYRVRLTTAQGVLRWDVDPYLCDCTEPPRMFRTPVHQALQITSVQPLVWEPPSILGAKLWFTVHDTENEPAVVYADASLTIPLRNPLPANAAGFFPPVYLADGVKYRVRMLSHGGATLLDVDPYFCQCGFFYLTSAPYAYIAVDGLANVQRSVENSIDLAFDAVASVSRSVVSGEMVLPLIDYDAGFDGVTLSARSVVSGTMAVPIVTYDAYTRDGLEVTTRAVGDGTMIAPLVFYDAYGRDGLTVSARSVVSGTMT